MMEALPLRRLDTGNRREISTAYSHGRAIPFEILSDFPRASNATLDSTNDGRCNSAGFDALLRATACAASSASTKSSYHSQTLLHCPQLSPRMNSQPGSHSLPPLKSVLGDRLTSPPASPRTKGANLQPFPCEPAYMTKTYKPPSLYPSKKVCTEPSPATIPRALPSDGHNRPKYTSSTSQSFPRDLAYRQATKPEEDTRGRLARSYPSHDSFDNDHGRYALQHSTDPHGVHRGSYGVDGHYTLEVPTDHSRRSTSRHGPHYSYVENDASCYGYRGIGYDAGIGDRHVQNHAQHHSMLSKHNHHEQPPLFLGDGYGYQQNKARKRSNLPKQSTEIMKTWFDQNIDNPYPSEEQKAIFSTATGISMTQVSNWFINHRRRCPELRDKRGKPRPIGDDL